MTSTDVRDCYGDNIVYYRDSDLSPGSYLLLLETLCIRDDQLDCPEFLSYVQSCSVVLYINLDDDFRFLWGERVLVSTDHARLLKCYSYLFVK